MPGRWGSVDGRSNGRQEQWKKGAVDDRSRLTYVIETDSPAAAAAGMT